MRVVEFRFWPEMLAETRDTAPEMVLEWEKADVVGDTIRLLLWASDGDFDAFEQGLTRDRTIRWADVAGEPVGERRLYQIELTATGVVTSLYPLVVDAGGFIEYLATLPDGWRCKIAFPDEDAISELFVFLSEHSIPYDINRITDDRYETPGAGPTTTPLHGMGVTDRQREVLVQAVDTGYLKIPREKNLAELGESLGVSGTAASHRFRRGAETLIEQTVYPVDPVMIESTEGDTGVPESPVPDIEPSEDD